MAKMFYNLEEATQKLGVNRDQFKQMVASGNLHQFRDRDTLMFKRDQVDALADARSEAPAPPASPPGPQSGPIMNIVTGCPKCSAVYRLAEEKVGRQAKCKCGHVFIVAKAAERPVTPRGAPHHGSVPSARPTERLADLHQAVTTNTTPGSAPTADNLADLQQAVRDRNAIRDSGHPPNPFGARRPSVCLSSTEFITQALAGSARCNVPIKETAGIADSLLRALSDRGMARSASDILRANVEGQLLGVCPRCNQFCSGKGLLMLATIAFFSEVSFMGNSGSTKRMLEGKCPNPSCKNTTFDLFWRPQLDPAMLANLHSRGINIPSQPAPSQPVCTIIILESSAPPNVALIQSIVDAMNIKGGRVSVREGPPQVNEHLAGFMLAKFDSDNGTDYLGRTFDYGTGKVAGVNFAFIKVL